MCPFESCHLLLWWQVKRRVKHRARWHLSKWKLVPRSLSFVATKIFETHFAELLALCFCLVHSCLGWEAQRACHTELVVQQWLQVVKQLRRWSILNHCNATSGVSGFIALLCGHHRCGSLLGMSCPVFRWWHWACLKELGGGEWSLGATAGILVFLSWSHARVTFLLPSKSLRPNGCMEWEQKPVLFPKCLLHCLECLPVLLLSWWLTMLR